MKHPPDGPEWPLNSVPVVASSQRQKGISKTVVVIATGMLTAQMATKIRIFFHLGAKLPITTILDIVPWRPFSSRNRALPCALILSSGNGLITRDLSGSV